MMKRTKMSRTRGKTLDPVELAIFKNAFHSIAEEMGAALRRTAFSPNIKERRDYSSALFDGHGRVIAMGDHMPVHLGSMPLSVRAVLDSLTLDPGDAALVNDPFAGGTHLPDLTVVMPVFVQGRKEPAFYVANRAHHADVGGSSPGSMGLSREIYQEGLRIPPLKILSRGVMNREILALILNNVRTAWEREGDLMAQIGSCRIGAERLAGLVAGYGYERVAQRMGDLLRYSELLMRAELKHWPGGEFTAEDFLDDDGFTAGPVKIRATIRFQPRRGAASVDFAGSDPQVGGSVNAVYAITYSAVFYVFRCLLPEDAPPTAGLMKPVDVRIPAGTVVNASSPSAVAGGNVETSQRIVDVLLRALAVARPERIPAASSGTMNNLTVGGTDPRTGRPFAYYETIAGGMGARPRSGGLSGVHTHMTNSMNTPIEALEYAYPFRVTQYSYRRGSGGGGRYRGGDGLVREVEFLSKAQVNLLSDRRRFPPYGLAGGSPGQRGRSVLLSEGVMKELPGKCNLHVQPGTKLRIETPGGGGWGKPVRSPRKQETTSKAADLDSHGRLNVSEA
ncbi:MAG TPA: hydantoinase B/oxoprolinase family protein [Terriglobia bacterium]|nr:hydantoinase B/oxoprolinase family protein [Terriglobia bacterium]